MKDFGFYRISFSFLRSCFSSTYRKLISNLVEMCVNSRTHPHPLRRKPRAAHLGQASGGHRLICRMAPVVEHLKKGNRGSRFGVSASEKLCSMRCRVWPKLLKAAVRFALSALSKSTQIESYIKHGLISFKGLRSRTRVQRNTISLRSSALLCIFDTLIDDSFFRNCDLSFRLIRI